MRILAVAIVLLLGGLPVHARSPGCDGNPRNLRCQPSDFLNPVFGDAAWYRANPIAAEATVRDCTKPLPFPGYIRPNRAACQAAASALMGRR